jgi:hypothetical protein
LCCIIVVQGVLLVLSLSIHGTVVDSILVPL